MNTYTLAANRLSWPTDWADIFGRQAPVIMEIGFGNADFLVDLARRRLDANILGLEISRPSLSKAERKVLLADLHNVRLLQATAQLVVWTLCRPVSLQSVFINFPDPWPRDSHHWRRLISENFLRLLASRMVTTGHLNIATDHAGYAAWISKNLESCPFFDSRRHLPYSRDDPTRLRTKYEQKALAAGNESFYFHWRRNALPVPGIYAVPKELPMPHAIMQGSHDLSEIARHFQPREWLYSTEETGSIVVRLIDLYVSQGHPTLAIDTFIGEGPFSNQETDGKPGLGPPVDRPLEQRLLLAITRRAEGDFLIHLHETGFPRPTRGVHFAIDRLANWLACLDPPLIRVRDNLQFPPD